MVEQHQPWPTSSQKELLRATFLSGDEGIKAFETWKSQIDMADHPDIGSFRLLPLLSQNLKSQGSNDPLLMKLNGIARRNWYQNQRFFRNWAPSLKALHEAGITCMLLNGSAIALHYCREYALESETNLAISIPAAQVRQTILQLQSLGWKPKKQLSKALLEPYLAANWQHVFQDASGHQIQLCWRLLPAYRPVDTDFWGRAVVTKVHDAPVYILSPTDQILFSCTQDDTASEQSTFLRAIDVMLIHKNSPRLDWENFLTLAERHHLIMPVVTVISYLQTVLNEPVPAVFWQQFQSLPISWQDRQEYKLKTSGPLLWHRFWRIWFDYQHHTLSTSLLQAILGFPRHLQHYWGLSELRHVFSSGMSISRQHMRRVFRRTDFIKTSDEKR